MSKFRKDLLAMISNKKAVKIVSNIQNTIERFQSEYTNGIECLRISISRQEAIAVLSCKILPPEGMIMSNKIGKPVNFKYFHNANETRWLEVYLDEIKRFADTDLEFEVWVTRSLPFGTGERRAVIIPRDPRPY